MKTIKQFPDFLLYSNIFISVCAAAMTAETYVLLDIPIHWMYISFVFFSTLIFYDFPSLYFAGAAFSANQSERHRWIVENRLMLMAFTVLAAFALAVTVFYLPFVFILSLVPNAVLAFAYFFPQTHLRRIIGLKAGIVALVWTMTTAFYPLFLLRFLSPSDMFLNLDNYAVMLERFFFMLPLCIIFNVRDIEADRNAGIRTFPVIYGVKATVVICILSLSIFEALVMLQYGLSGPGIVLTVSSVISGFLILAASPRKSDYYYSFWIDGMILLQASLAAAIHYL